MDVEQLRDLARRAANSTDYRQVVAWLARPHGSLPVTLPPITILPEEASLIVLTTSRS